MSKTIKNLISYSLILLAILTLGAITLMAKEANAGDNAFYSAYNEPDLDADNDLPSRNPAPVVASINPSSGNLGGSSKTVTITGSGFVPHSVARLNGSDRPTTFVDYSHLLIHLNASDMYGASGKYITVWNPAPGGGYSNGVLFTINGYVAPKASSTGSTATSGNTSTRNSNSNNSGSVEGASDTNNGIPTTDDYSALASNAIFGSNGFMPSGLVQWLLFAIFILLIIIIVRKVFFADKYHQTPLKHA